MSKKAKVQKQTLSAIVAEHSENLLPFTGDDATLKSVHNAVADAIAALGQAKELGVTDRVRGILVANLERCANQIARAARACRSPEKKAADSLLKQIEKARAAGVDISALLGG